MPRYRYAGPAPVPGDDGEAVHPGDVREYGKEPGWGPWELIPAPEAGRADDGPTPPAVPAPEPTVPPVTPKGK